MEHEKLKYDTFTTADYSALHQEFSSELGPGIDRQKWESLCRQIKEKCDVALSEYRLE